MPSQVQKMTRARRRQRGSMLIELLIAMSVLAVGLGGVLALLVSAVLTNSKSEKDTSATIVAENIL